MGLLTLFASGSDDNDPSGLGLPEDGHRVISPEEFRSGVAVLEIDPWLLRYLADHPEEIRNLGRWDFQAFIAQLIHKHGGYSVRLGAKGRDGGVDVFAERASPLGPELLLVQCKHPDPGNKVDIDTVRLLYYQVNERKATHGLVATSSRFTSAALKEIQEHKYRMAAADRAKVEQWLVDLRDRV